jgi:DNA-binding transcriptional MocR family regulator
MSIVDTPLTCPKTYHEWMKSPELLELTASEPLTFDEEMEMQRERGGTRVATVSSFSRMLMPSQRNGILTRTVRLLQFTSSY